MGSKTNRVLTIAFLASFTIVLILGLSGCSNVTEGVITSKNYVPPSTWWSQQCVTYDSKGQCKVWMPVQNTDPECWQLSLKNAAEDTGDICIDPESWRQVRPGEPWPPLP